MKASKMCLIAALAAGVMLAYSPALRAQDANANKDPKTHQRHGAAMKERLDKMAKDLNLTADQKTKVEALMKEEGQKMRGMRDLSKDERRAKMKTAHEDMNKKMKEILTADQFTKWEKMRSAERRGGKRGGHKRGGDQQ